MQIIQELKEKLQVLLTGQIFFATMIYGFSKVGNSNDVIANGAMITFGGIGGALCLLNYLFVDRADPRKIMFLGLAKISILINFVCLIFAIAVLALGNSMPYYYFWPLMISLMGILLVPIITMIILIMSEFSRRK